MSATALVIVGAGGHAVSVTNVALSCGFDVIAYVDDAKAGTRLMDVPVIDQQECLRLYARYSLFVAIGDNALRERVSLEYKQDFPNAHFPSLIHPSSVIGAASKVAEGVVVMPLVNVGPNSDIGNFCILNSSSSVDHDSVLHDFASLAPGSICGGSVNIGTRSVISIGAVVKHGVNIGADTVIGAKSYVHRSIGNNVIAYGTPCKKIRNRKTGERYLT